MKYTVYGFQQKKLVDYQMDTRDALFLRWFLEYQATGKMKEVTISRPIDQWPPQAEESAETQPCHFYWLNHQTVVDELPIMGHRTPETFRKYISKLVTKGVLDHHIIRRGKDQGTAVYYRINKALMDDLTRYDAKAEEHRHDDAGSHRHDDAGTTPARECRSDSLYNDSFYKDQQHNPESPVVDFAKLEKGEVEKVMDALEDYGVSDNIASKQAIQKAVDNGLSMDDATAFFSHCIDKTKAKKGIQNIQGYALTLFSNATELSAFKEATKPQQPEEERKIEPDVYCSEIEGITGHQRRNFEEFLEERYIFKADRATYAKLWEEFQTTERLVPAYKYAYTHWIDHEGSQEERTFFLRYARENGKNFRVTPDFTPQDAKREIDELYNEFVLFRRTQDLPV